ncbi:MAG: hypothetical protein HOL29_08775 [Euryarchaeota archaeon]|nr:hypothetical protein [Euryarchaeota archaeon]
MDTHKQMKAQGINVPSTFAEFLTGIQPVDDGENIEVPQIGQGSGTYKEAIKDVKVRASTADFVTHQLGQGADNVPGLSIFGKQHQGNHKEAAEHGKRLKTRQEIGYD